ncbi:hypothetical protein F4805DRAFT_418594 [Annulohypoxylon moriforme]|nr:hypothetical protein F4805DRAFT_418594 [Annulohypoxylon moriforme]
METSSVAAFPPGYAEQDLGPRTQAVAIAFIVLEVVIVTLRFSTRAIYKSRWGFDDYLIVPGLVFALGVCAITIIEVHIAGVGRHLAVLYATNPGAVVNWAKCGYAIECLYGVGVAFPKLSILASYLRIFTTKPYRITTYILIFLVSAIGLSVVVTSLSSCHPFSARWDTNLYVTNCINAPRFWQASNIPNVITDVMMLILPLPVVWGLHIDLKQKLALTGIFVLGSFGIIASIIRITVVFRVTTLSDGTWDSADIAMWSAIESGVYLIAACLPVLRPLYLSVINGITKAIKVASTDLRSVMGSGAKTLVSNNSEDQERFVYVQMESLQMVSAAHDVENGNNHSGVFTSVESPAKPNRNQFEHSNWTK